MINRSLHEILWLKVVVGSLLRYKADKYLKDQFTKFSLLPYASEEVEKPLNKKFGISAKLFRLVLNYFLILEQTKR